ncbi:hypothetical protein R69746_08474 [Paraburkholderia aspalathi]|nr:hypothetical protein R69746_08474 [Paraburkholderia aspalathi]
MFAASVDCVPAATLITCRSAPAAPTLTTLLRPPSEEFAPNATELVPVLAAPLPSATELLALGPTEALGPMAIEFAAVGSVAAPFPNAIEFISPAEAVVPLPRPVIWLPPIEMPFAVFSA